MSRPVLCPGLLGLYTLQAQKSKGTAIRKDQPDTLLLTFSLLLTLNLYLWHIVFDTFFGALDNSNGLLQVVIVGNGAVGKSSMIQRYCKGTFTKEYKKTIGVDFLERQIT